MTYGVSKMVEFYDSGSYVDLYGKFKNAFAESRGAIVEDYIKGNNLKVNNYLDLACGTGIFLDIIQKSLKINNCVGLDYSKKMIEYAQKNFSNDKIKFVYGNMADFDLKEKFDFVSCNYDAINFLTNFNDWQKTFECVYNHLEKGGTFTFDFNTIRKMKIIKGGYIFKEEEGCDIFQYADNCGCKINLKYTIYNKKSNGLYAKENTSLTEGVFENYKILRALRNVGFKNIKFCNENFEKCNKRRALRLFVICNK